MCILQTPVTCCRIVGNSGRLLQCCSERWTPWGETMSSCMRRSSSPLTNWKYEPSPRPPTHSVPISNKHTEQVKNYVWICHGMHWPPNYRSKLSNTRIWLSWLSKKMQTHPPKPAEVEPSFRKVCLPPATLCMLFPAYLWVREFWPQIYSLLQALYWGLLSKILGSMKMGRAYNAKRPTF